jgi:hypothetical protein
VIRLSLYLNGSNVRYRKQESYQRHDGVDITKVLKLGENAKLKHNAADGVALVNQVIITISA